MYHFPESSILDCFRSRFRCHVDPVDNPLICSLSSVLWNTHLNLLVNLGNWDTRIVDLVIYRFYHAFAQIFFQLDLISIVAVWKDGFYLIQHLKKVTRKWRKKKNIPSKRSSTRGSAATRPNISSNGKDFRTGIASLSHVCFWIGRRPAGRLLRRNWRYTRKLAIWTLIANDIGVVLIVFTIIINDIQSFYTARTLGNQTRILTAQKSSALLKKSSSPKKRTRRGRRTLTLLLRRRKLRYLFPFVDYNL